MSTGQEFHVGPDPSVAFVNQGARVRVCVNDPSLVPRIACGLPVGSQIDGAWPPDAQFTVSVADPMANGTALHRLYLGSVLLQSTRRLEPLLARLESELHFAVAMNARSSLFVHAGVVGWRGRAMLFPGRSMSGKSSLVVALMRAGADYYSDEYAVIDAQGLIHPYPKPLGIRGPAGGTRLTTAESVGGRVGARPLRAGLIVSTHYRPGVRFEPKARRPSRGLMALISNTIAVRRHPRFALDHLTPVALEARTFEGVRGDADEAADWLLRCQDAEETDASADGSPSREE